MGTLRVAIPKLTGNKGKTPPPKKKTSPMDPTQGIFHCILFKFSINFSFSNTVCLLESTCTMTLNNANRLYNTINRLPQR